MAAFASFLSSSIPPPRILSSFHHHHNYSPFVSPLSASVASNPRKTRTLILASSSDDFISISASSSHQKWNSRDKKSVLSDLIQEIEPLDVSLIQRDVPPTTLDAMKRTISGMLGLLPSNRFKVSIEALWEPLSKLLVSSMMTGYTLRNAEYRLCLERNLEVHEGFIEKPPLETCKHDLLGTEFDSVKMNKYHGNSDKSEKVTEDPSDNISIEGLGEMSPEAEQYILHLESCLSSVKKELHEVKRKSAALQMQQFVGEEKNDLLDYLRSLQPEKHSPSVSNTDFIPAPWDRAFSSTLSHVKPRDLSWSSQLIQLNNEQVAELSEPTSPELKEVIHSAVHGLLATLSPKMHSKAPPQSENTSTGTRNIGGEDCAELVENTSLQFQPLISLTRDYLARLLFWCMLLGHYLRGLEYRMQLMELLSLTSNMENDAYGDEQIA